jgi:hypothetical protein
MRSQSARERERELHSVERYTARTTHRDRFSTRNLPRAVSRPVRVNAGAAVSFSPGANYFREGVVNRNPERP